jgi:hypothetical protein
MDRANIIAAALVFEEVFALDAAARIGAPRVEITLCGHLIVSG